MLYPGAAHFFPCFFGTLPFTNLLCYSRWFLNCSKLGNNMETEEGIPYLYGFLKFGAAFPFHILLASCLILLMAPTRGTQRKFLFGEDHRIAIRQTFYFAVKEMMVLGWGRTKACDQQHRTTMNINSTMQTTELKM
jgi:hypothetical protein